MKEIIKELKMQLKNELFQVGLTPTSSFKGTQEEHDEIHSKKAKKYEEAIRILKGNIQIRDFSSSEIHNFKSLKKADKKIKELDSFEEADYQVYILIKDTNKIK